MKNKQINKFLLMFFISFTLFFSVSNAGIVANELYTSSSSSFTSSSSSSSLKLEGYAPGNIAGSVYSYIVNEDSSILDSILLDLSSKGYSKSIIYTYMNGSVPRYSIAIFPDEFNFDFTQTDSNPVGNKDYIGVYASSNSYFYTFYYDRGSTYGSTITITSDTFTFNSDVFRIIGTSSSYSSYRFLEFRGISEVKKMTNDSGYFVWDGESYYYKSQTESDNPSINYDLANILQIIKNSSEVQDNVYPYLEDYFIVPNGTFNNEQIFSIYFYYPSVNLAKFDYVFNDVKYYDLDKVSIDGVVSNLTYYLGGNTSSNVVKDVQKCTLYYDPDIGTGEVYFNDTRTLDQLKSFNSETQPIIYTTKNIEGYTATWGETDTEWTATRSEDKDVLTSDVIDSEGNIVSPVLPGSSSVLLGETPLERLGNLIKTSFEGLVASLFDGSFRFTEVLEKKLGVNLFTIVLSVILKSISVFFSSILLIFRFIAFILTLSTIPSNSSLLNIDVVTNTTGIVFNGLNWGSRLIEGLNFIKSIQWNGLGLWTLFEVFVVSLEVVIFVKIIRKNYHSL